MRGNWSLLKKKKVRILNTVIYGNKSQNNIIKISKVGRKMLMYQSGSQQVTTWRVGLFEYTSQFTKVAAN